MFHLFNTDEDHEPSVLGVLIALLLAIPFCLAWVVLFAINHKSVSSVDTVFAGSDTPKHVAGKLA
jgi:hypothetical protein